MKKYLLIINNFFFLNDDTFKIEIIPKPPLILTLALFLNDIMSLEKQEKSRILKDVEFRAEKYRGITAN